MKFKTILKKSLAFFLTLCLVLSFSSCIKQAEKPGTKKGMKLLSNKTPVEIYSSSIDYIKGLTNYEIIVETAHTIGDGDEAIENSSRTVYKSSGNTYSFFSDNGEREEFLLHDGKKIYQNINGIKEQQDMSYEEFVSIWGTVNESGMLLELPEEKLADQTFIYDGDGYRLDISISELEYLELAGINVLEPIAYHVYFDQSGFVSGYSRLITYEYYEGVRIDDYLKVTIKNVGEVEKLQTPQNPESYAIRPEADEIDLSLVNDLSVFTTTKEQTDYVVITMKTDGTVKLDETTTAEGYEAKLLVRLYPDVAPETVETFKKLVSDGFYNSATVESISAEENSHSTIRFEEKAKEENISILGEYVYNGFTNNLSHTRGVLSALSDYEAGTSMNSLFFCKEDSPGIDGAYASFGYVVNGIEQLDVISTVELDESTKPKSDIVITDISFVKKLEFKQ